MQYAVGSQVAGESKMGSTTVSLEYSSFPQHSQEFPVVMLLFHIKYHTFNRPSAQSFLTMLF